MSDQQTELTMTADTLLSQGLRALFTFSVTERFFTESAENEKDIFYVLKDIYADLEGRFGAKVLGTLDNDLLVVGASSTEPISYILTEVPDLESVVAITNLVRTRFKGAKLARYLRVEARVGRPLFFGTV